MKFKMIKIIFLLLLTTAYTQIPTDVALTPVLGTGSSGDVNLARPLWMGEVPGQPGMFYVLEQHVAKIVVLENSGGGYGRSDLYELQVRGENEEGLLGFAFHPDFQTNRKYYIYYSPAGGERRAVVEERTVDNTFKNDAGTSREIMSISQPYWNHNGGTIDFGADGYLYIGPGDGGSGNDPQNYAQNMNSLLGKMLRIDVDNTSNGNEYAIPSDNPFVNDNNARPEIWAYGLRNPWKWSFDPLTNDLWAGDVGQNTYEEITIVTAGAHMGWKTMEGFHCRGGGNNCNADGKKEPVLELTRGEATSITGGYVYRGNPTSVFYGAYIFGDYNTRRIWAIPADDRTTKIEIARANGGITSFGTDMAGNIYVVERSGTIKRLDHATLQPVKNNLPKISKPFFLKNKNTGKWQFNFKDYPNVKEAKIFTLSGYLMQTLDKNSLLKVDSSLKVSNGVFIAKISGANSKKSQLFYLQ